MNLQFFKQQQKIFENKVCEYLSHKLNKKIYNQHGFIHLSGNCIKKIFGEIYHDIKINNRYRFKILNKIIKYKNMDLASGNLHVNDTVYIIGRKYKGPDGKIDINAFSKLIKYIPVDKNTIYKKSESNYTNTINCQQIQQELLTVTQSANFIELCQKCYGVDIEYITDIIDNYKDFPNSIDLSHIFMIGYQHFIKRVPNVYSLSKINPADEYKLLHDWMMKLPNNSFIIHWGVADRVYLLKSFKKWGLDAMWDKRNIQFINLLDIVKKNSDFKSYNLKTISSILLDYQYKSDCKNGLEALLNTINKYHTSKSDLIKYNKEDTLLIKKLVEYFFQI